MIDVTFFKIAETAGVYVPTKDEEDECETLVDRGLVGRFAAGKAHGYHLVKKGYDVLHDYFGHPTGFVDVDGRSKEEQGGGGRTRMSEYLGGSSDAQK